jgi:hypothetical protein
VVIRTDTDEPCEGWHSDAKYGGTGQNKTRSRCVGSNGQFAIAR